MISQRDDYRSFANLKERALRLQHRDDKLRTSRHLERKGKNTRLCPPWVSTPPRQSPRNAKYCPVAAANSPESFAIAPLTFRQCAAANKIHSHINLACHSTPLRMTLQAPARMRESLGPNANTRAPSFGTLLQAFRSHPTSRTSSVPSHLLER